MSENRPPRRRGNQDHRPASDENRASASADREAQPVPEHAETGADHPQYGDLAAHELPHETLSPITLAAGIALLGFGVLTTPLYSVAGIAVMAWAIWKWIGEMQHG